MFNSLPEFNLKGKTIMAVPAVHYRALFAEYVNQACSGIIPTPDAIAVELGPSAVAAIVSWFKELGIGQKSKTRLPCMFGLIRHNQHIHPSLKQVAIQLQEITGKYIEEIDPEILKKYLGFSPTSLLCLSPTDSIIEAIRCALELDIPVYGIDLDDFSAIEHNSILIEDPLTAQNGLTEYVKRNGRFSESARDEIIDGRREYVMAARLKFILGRHKRILFTCGLAHWNALHLLLNQTSLMAATNVPCSGKIQYQRVLVYPTLALAQMDLFPKITTLYEQRRQPANQNPRKTIKFIDYNRIFRNLMQLCYNKYHSSQRKKAPTEGKIQDFYKIPQFEVLLANYSILNQKMVPSTYEILKVAESTMSKEFCETIAAIMMDFNWISPQDYPSIPILEPEPLIEGDRPKIKKTRRVALLIPRNTQNNESNETIYFRSKTFYFSNLNEIEYNGNIEHMWYWKDAPPVYQNSGKWRQCRVWPPHDLLVLASAYQAGRIANSLGNEKKIEQFEGSLMDGFDIRATLRSVIRGENQIYVRNTPGNINYTEEPKSYLDPTIFIFSEPTNSDSAEWYLFAGSLKYNYQRHIKNLTRFNEIIHNFGDLLVQAVGFLRMDPVPINLKSYVIEAHYLFGFLYFECPCQNALQEVKWLEETDFKRAPIIQYAEMNELINMYSERHHIQLSYDDWVTTLIRMAIPYARKRVIVVIPADYRLQPMIYAEARAFKIQIAVIPLAYFSAEIIEKMRVQYSVEPEDKDGLHYPRELERLLGQSVKAYSNLLPKHLLYQQENE